MIQWLVLTALVCLPLSSAFALERECEVHFQRNPFIASHGLANFKSAHDSITSDLFSGEIISLNRFSENENQNAVYVVMIKGRDPFTGAERVREAIFKPRVWGDKDGWVRTPMEFVAYDLNVKLGMDYVPPTAYRKNLHLEIDGQIFTEGAFMFKAPSYNPLKNFPEGNFPASNKEILADNRIMNVLLQNPDAHSKNLGTGNHWVDGYERPVFIDWGASLRQGTQVSMTEYHATGNSAPVSFVRRETYEALKKLKHDNFKNLVDANFLSWDEVNGILSRRDGIVSYIDQLIIRAQEQGKSVDEILL